MKTKLKTTELECTRHIPKASPEEVYDVWIDPACPGGPWHGSTKVVLTAKVDGLFHTSLVHEGTRYAHYGMFTKLERGKLVEHTWVSEGTKGLESIVSTTFEPRDGGTFVTLRHTGVPDDDESRMHLEGWNFVLGCLAEMMPKNL
jgi:uncharacterized protein YndB with AHSA1/START domain